MLLWAPLAAQDLKPRPLPLPQDSPIQAPEVRQAAPAKPDPAKQMAKWRELTAQGDKDAPFQLGVMYLIGQGVTQDAAQAEEFFKKAEMTAVRKCFVGEAYVETALPGRVEAALRWAGSTEAACSDWEQAQWYGSNLLGMNTAKEVEYLKKGLEVKTDGYGREIRARLGELILGGKAVALVGGTAEERVSWIGDAARQRVANAEFGIGSAYAQHAEESDSPTTSIEWVRKAARYGIPRALAVLGQAVMRREISDLSYVDGMAFYDLAMKQNPLGGVALENMEKQLEPEQREEMLDVTALWQRVARETGGFYTKGDALRMDGGAGQVDAPKAGSAAGAGSALDMDVLTKAATAANPDAELRLAFVYEGKGELGKAEALYREAAKNGPGELWVGLAESAGTAGKWKWARELYEWAAGAGSRKACAEVAQIDAEGLAGDKDPVGAYVWLMRSDSPDAKLVAERKAALTKDQAVAAQLSQAKWVAAHKEWYSEKEVKAAEETLGSAPVGRVNYVSPRGAIPVTGLPKQ